MHYYEEDLAYIQHVGFSTFAREASPWVVSRLRSAGIKKGTIVELGCGGGVLLAALIAAGYETLGIDASAPILAIAKATAPAADLKQASLYDAPLPRCAAVIAMGEGLNYVTETDALPQTSGLFARIASALDANGLFLFDVITRGRDTNRSYRSWAAGPDWACLVEVAPEPDGCHLRRAITTFRSVEGSSYRRGHEEHRVYLFSRAELLSQLQEAGFRVRTARAYGKVPLAPGRSLFIASPAPG
ncbi:MAG TPA: methyltransferase domain-containing protein [Thermoanaerobaculia bacterium]|nr:methyltransferase domain-containing protein [Thermoanaerobaculia bacterium]